MHRFFVPRIDAERVAFSAEQTHQIRDVLRLKAGDRVRVFDGLEAVDRVVELPAGRIVDTLPQAPEPATRLIVYAALLQRDKFETVLQKLTEVGAAAVVPVITTRALVRTPPDEQRRARWRAIVREAAEQSGRGILPELCGGMSFAEAVRGAAGARFLADPGGRPLRAALALAPEISLFVGPEGGFTSDELGLATSAGIQIVSLGGRTLRTETASPVFAALVLYELGQL